MKYIFQRFVYSQTACMCLCVGMCACLCMQRSEEVDDPTIDRVTWWAAWRGGWESHSGLVEGQHILLMTETFLQLLYERSL